jgi:hypothetical protein
MLVLHTHNLNTLTLPFVELILCAMVFHYCLTCDFWHVNNYYFLAIILEDKKQNIAVNIAGTEVGLFIMTAHAV